MNAVEELQQLRERYGILTDSLDRIAHCDVTDVRTRAQIYAQWARLQERRCREPQWFEKLQRAGELIADGQKKGEIAVPADGGRPPKLVVQNDKLFENEPKAKPKTLTELGITRDQSSQWKHAPQLIARAEKALRDGGGWRDVAAKFGLGHCTLLRRIDYRKRRAPFTTKEAALAMKQLDGGATWTNVAAQFDMKRSTLEFRLFKFGWRGKHTKIAA